MSGEGAARPRSAAKVAAAAEEALSALQSLETLLERALAAAEKGCTSGAEDLVQEAVGSLGMVEEQTHRAGWSGCPVEIGDAAPSADDVRRRSRLLAARCRAGLDEVSSRLRVPGTLINVEALRAAAIHAADEAAASLDLSKPFVTLEDDHDTGERDDEGMDEVSVATTASDPMRVFLLHERGINRSAEAAYQKALDEAEKFAREQAQLRAAASAAAAPAPAPAPRPG
jgi:hypothetical protein